MKEHPNHLNPRRGCSTVFERQGNFFHSYALLGLVLYQMVLYKKV